VWQTGYIGYGVNGDIRRAKGPYGGIPAKTNAFDKDISFG
jgi:hypothetical protein